MDAGEPATGEPVRAMVLLDESDAMGLTYTSNRAAMDAMAEEINATGGLGDSGRPVELVYCVTQFDPNLAQQCARDAVADDSVLARGRPDHQLSRPGEPDPRGGRHGLGRHRAIRSGRRHEPDRSRSSRAT